MSRLQDVLRLIQLWEFVVVAAVALFSWIRHRGDARAWVAATFVLLAGVVVAARLIPEGSTDPLHQTLLKILLACLVLFPYLLFRFTATFRSFARWVEVIAATATVVVSGWAFTFERLPRQGEVRPREFEVYVIALVLQWTVVSAFVVTRLWRSGRGQPRVARRRMQTLALGTLSLALAILVSGSSGSPAEPGPIQIFTGLLTILSAPLFLFGFAPPRIAVAMWRRSEELALRDAEKGLMQAESPDEVARIVLPHAARLFGGRQARLMAGEGSLLGVFDDPASAGSHGAAESIAVKVGEGSLEVKASPFAPFFGPEERDILGVLGTLTELALVRTQQAAELRAATEAMREFVAIASHDLRTPITVIKGMGMLLQTRWENTPAETRMKQIDAIVRQSGALSRLVDDLLIVSRIEGAAVEADPQSVAVRLIVEQIIADEGVDGFELQVPEDLEVIADPSHLTRMLGNYMRNAKTYGQPPFVVEAVRNGATAEISVVDHGSGVPTAFQPRLFDKFARADKRQSNAHGGTGLGLSIVRGLAQASQGEAWFTPMSPNGARFSIRLPTPKEGRWKE